MARQIEQMGGARQASGGKVDIHAVGGARGRSQRQRRGACTAARAKEASI
jgi:hypothetical protein